MEGMLFLELQIDPSLFFSWYLNGGAATHEARKILGEVSQLPNELVYAPDTLRLIKVLWDVIEVFDVLHTILSKLKVGIRRPFMSLRSRIGVI